MKCNKCGTDNPNGTVFCVNCGARMEAQDPWGNNAPPPQSGQEPWSNNAPPQQQNYSQQGNYYQQPYDQSYAQQAAAESAATKALVFGILGCCLGGWLWLVLSIVFFSTAKKQGYKGNKALIGLILAIVGTVLWTVLLIVLYSGILAAGSALSSIGFLEFA